MYDQEQPYDYGGGVADSVPSSAVDMADQGFEFEEQAWQDELDDFLMCDGCRRHPSELPEYLSIDPELQFYSAPSHICWEEEGTLNRVTGRFLCNLCYIRAGMPSSPQGWKVGD